MTFLRGFHLQRYHFALPWRVTEYGPCVHQLAAFFEQIAAPVCSFGRVAVVCASAISQTSCGKFVWSGGPIAKRRTEAVHGQSSRPIRCRFAGAPASPCCTAGALRAGRGIRIARRRRVAVSARFRRHAAKGARDARHGFIRAAGIVHSAASRSISAHSASMASVVRVAVRIANSRARAAMPPCARRASMKAPVSR